MTKIMMAREILLGMEFLGIEAKNFELLRKQYGLKGLYEWIVRELQAD